MYNEKDIRKYINLVYDTQQAHRPFSTAILLIDVDEATGKVTKIKPHSFLIKPLADILESKISMQNTINEIDSYAKFLLTKD